MNEQKNIWKKILEVIVKLLKLLIKTPEQQDPQQNPSGTFSDVVKETASDFILDEAPKLVKEYGDLIDTLSPKQRELVAKIAILKSLDKSQMTLDEIIEEGEALAELSELNAEITKDLGKFWSKFRGIVVETTNKFVDVGAKVAAGMLVTAIL